MSNKQPITCPYCNSRNIAKFLYGMPVFNVKLEKELAKGKVILGGCCIEMDAPTFHCNDCKKEWNSDNVKKVK